MIGKKKGVLRFVTILLFISHGEFVWARDLNTLIAVADSINGSEVEQISAAKSIKNFSETKVTFQQIQTRRIDCETQIEHKHFPAACYDLLAFNSNLFKPELVKNLNHLANQICSEAIRSFPQTIPENLSRVTAPCLEKAKLFRERYRYKSGFDFE